ncbi:hypothetical protein CAI21_07845 [Alkalilimnicola ehrlichii]|uniref:Uncharacterized protein n=1 Tax=Alkalilimnicola ehrlichii TaxID=351052 RepID=A0A3E0WWS0_9GAMM|nr:hypothetical protein [Alkalilimnicola ehrlichii]RFA30104.1 hypothetical protein CAI21_07845 [Alkalilimnicola ehrlichii]RFA37450.1 hypothetical protein CAL65_09190 [Alkalilimnicola ehrlichii]
MTTTKRILLTLLLLLSPVLGWGSLTPETFLQLEVEVRELTLAGMERRIELLANQATRVEDTSLDNRTRRTIDAVYAEYGTSAGEHAAYGRQNSQAIEAWLDDNPSWKFRLLYLDNQFETLSERMQAIRGE